MSFHLPIYISGLTVKLYYAGFTNTNTAKPFISNRITEIVDSFPPSMWLFTPSNDNPADLLTRGISAGQLLSSQLWSQGPQWLISETSRPKWLPANMQLSDSPDTDDTATHQDTYQVSIMP